MWASLADLQIYRHPRGAALNFGVGLMYLATGFRQLTRVAPGADNLKEYGLDMD
jgi:hypothetical protein